MITSAVIRKGAGYLTEHLVKNDYWADGEKQIEGEWIGLGAERLGLKGPLDEERFDQVRSNRNPLTGERLTMREDKDRVALVDIQLSAPKDVSVLAMVGGDERVVEAFHESVNTVFAEMERYAAVRERRGSARDTEKFRLTGNLVCGLFFHDASRDLDPQLHAHAVLANATWDEQRRQWSALQPAEMMRASGYLRQALYREIAGRLRRLGYETYGMDSNGFSIRGVEHLRERYSKRTQIIRKLQDEFAEKKGRRPTAKETAVLVRESRQRKLSEISTADVRQRQRQELNIDEAKALQQLVDKARQKPGEHREPREDIALVLERSIRHVFERKSVVREGELLQAALELNPDFQSWRKLREALGAHGDAYSFHGELSLRSVTREESLIVERFVKGLNTRFPLGDASKLPSSLTPGQRAAATEVLQSRDFAVVLIGDAGTGKTTALRSIEAVHRFAGGSDFLALAPTTRARDGLLLAGFTQAMTVQHFLTNASDQDAAMQRTLVVDEAGMLSMEQLQKLSAIAVEKRARLLLVGDTKQHQSVERGDALRNVVTRTHTTVVRLSEVLRQRSKSDRQFSRMMADGRAADAFDYAERHGLVQETGDDATLFRNAAAHYADNLAKGVDTLVVMPFWEEIERFNVEARQALRTRGLIGQAEVVRQAVKPLTWTKERKTYWTQYQPGDRLLFVRDTRYFQRGTSAEVVEILRDGLRVARPNGRFAKITRRQCAAFDVGRSQQLGVAVGDRILIRSAESSQRFANGDMKTVTAVDPVTNEVRLNDGKVLPLSFHAWTYGHAMTSYRAQGSTAEESLIVLGEVAERALTARQFYVGSTRYRSRHRIYVSHKEPILQRLTFADRGRETATEFQERNGLSYTQEISVRHLRHLGARRQQAIWRAMQAQEAHRQRQTQTRSQSMRR